VFLLFFAVLGASFLFPSLFSSDTMQRALTCTFFALPASCIVGSLLLRRFEAKNPAEAERSRRVDEEM
jgi:hypothetical protein